MKSEDFFPTVKTFSNTHKKSLMTALDENLGAPQRFLLLMQKSHRFVLEDLGLKKAVDYCINQLRMQCATGMCMYGLSGRN